jgi:hypothetical protein
METLKVSSFGFDPSRRAGFQFFDDFSDGFRTRQPEKRVNMIGHAIHG